MTESYQYAIGIPGVKWGDAEKKQWLAVQSVKRSYHDEVLAKLSSIPAQLEKVQYGSLSCDPERYPLFLIKTLEWRDNLPNVLVTGGVHGYETSGVQGAIAFFQTRLADYQDQFNFIIAPCLSPWGYETINRWNPDAVDPNRSFVANSQSEECRHLMDYIHAMGIDFFAHFDLHETTDTDNTEFRPALGARDGVELDVWGIPDGFYLVGNSLLPQENFQRAIITAVSKVTHIAPSDDNGKIIGLDAKDAGVIYLDVKKSGLCAGFTNAAYTTTTEVYPDSPRVDDENCIDAQVAAVTSGLDYINSL